MSGQPLPRGGPTAGRVALYAVAAAALLLAGVALGRASAPASAPTTTASSPAASPSAYCHDLTTLHADLQAAQPSYASPGPANPYASAELRDGGRIYSDAPTSTDPAHARALALALTLDAQVRQQSRPDSALLDRVGRDVVTAVQAAPSC